MGDENFIPPTDIILNETIYFEYNSDLSIIGTILSTTTNIYFMEITSFSFGIWGNKNYDIIFPPHIEFPVTKKVPVVFRNTNGNFNCIVYIKENKIQKLWEIIPDKPLVLPGMVSYWYFDLLLEIDINGIINGQLIYNDDSRLNN